MPKTNKRIIYDHPETGVTCVVAPAENSPKTFEEILERAVPEGVKYQVIDVSEIPKNRLFRNAWKCNIEPLTGKPLSIGTDMDKARNIHMNRIREKRNKLLADQDAMYMRAFEEGNVSLQKKIAAKKKALRDLPQTFDLSSATSESELVLLWPSDLEPHEDYKNVNK